jgi:putative ABC transport system permease protein
MSGLILDLRQSLRGFLRQPGFTAIAALALAIGVGSSTAMFSIVETVLRRPLPYAAPERLLMIAALDGKGQKVPLGPAQFLYLQENAASAEAVGVFTGGSGTIATPLGVKQAPVGHLSASLFKTLGMAPAFGRAFEPAEDHAGNDAVAVVSDAFWRRELAADPGALGRVIQIDRRAVTVVGVMPAGAIFPLLARYQLFVPLGITPQQLATPDDRTGLFGIVRMKTGVTPDGAKAEFDALLRAFSKNGVEATRFLPWLTESYAPALEAAFAAVLLLLLIACANVALLLLMRGTARARDLAIRAALGGGRGRIARQHVVEAIALALAGGALGLVLAAFAIRALAALAPVDLLPRIDELRVDWRVAAFALLASLAAGAAAGVVSAWQAQRTDLFGLLKDGGANSASAGRSRLRDGLVVAQLAVALVLAAGTGLLVRSMERLAAVPLGVDPTHLSGTFVYAQGEASPVAAAQLLRAARNTVGVEEASLAGVLPFERGVRSWGETVDIAGRTRPDGVWDVALPNWFTPGYLTMAGTRLLKGRDLADTDTATSTPVALVNQTFVDRFLAGRDPIGVSFAMTGWTVKFNVVGVVQDVRQWGPGEAVAPQVYLPHAQFALAAENYRRGFMLVTKSQQAPSRLESALRASAAGLSTQLLLGTTTPLDDYLGNWSRQRRFYLDIALVFAGAAIVLAALGVYGAMAFSVLQRRRELAVRAALGARARHLAGLVLARGVRLAAVGTCFGILGSLALSRFLAALLFGVGERDPLTFAVVVITLASVTVTASLLPAIAAARLDPMTVLRSE